MNRFIKSSPNSHGWVSVNSLRHVLVIYVEQVNPRDVEQLWKDMFEYFYRQEISERIYF